MRHVLGSRTELKHRKKLGARIDGEPEPHHLLVAPEPGAQFIQLEMRELEMAEEALVQGLCMVKSASEPGGDGGLSVALRPVRPRKGPVLRRVPLARLQPAGKGFSTGTRACDVEH
jgi:hypothetical protein